MVVIPEGWEKVIVWARPEIVKLWVTSGAGRNVLLPPCDAIKVQVPLETGLTVPADTEQILGELEAIVTARPELAVAVSV